MLHLRLAQPHAAVPHTPLPLAPPPPPASRCTLPAAFWLAQGFLQGRFARWDRAANEFQMSKQPFDCSQIEGLAEATEELAAQIQSMESGGGGGAAPAAAPGGAPPSGPASTAQRAAGAVGRAAVAVAALAALLLSVAN